MLEAHEAQRPLLVATSGSTGGARPVTRTTASWFDSFATVAELTGLRAGSRVLVPGPVAGTMHLFASVLARVVGAQEVGSVDRATHAHVTPTELRRLLARHDRLGGVHVTVAGDRLDEELHERAVRAGADVSHYYGAAELSFVAWGSHEHDLQVFPGVEAVERDGVLWVRSPFLATVATDLQGFATVGDHGTVTADGRVVVHGRGDAAVVTGGATVPVGEVETVLRRDLRGDVAVLGVPHAELGSVVAAVLTEADEVTAAHGRSRAELAETHRPRIWFVVDGLPLTPAGKVDRATLRGMAVSGGLRRVSPVGAR